MYITFLKLFRSKRASRISDADITKSLDDWDGYLSGSDISGISDNSDYDEDYTPNKRGDISTDDEDEQNDEVGEGGGADCVDLDTPDDLPDPENVLPEPAYTPVRSGTAKRSRPEERKVCIIIYKLVFFTICSFCYSNTP